MKRCPRCKEEVSQDAFASSGYCKPCNRARAREWRLAHPQRTYETKRLYREANRDTIRKQKLADYHALMAKDPERVRKRRREWAQTDKGVVANRQARHKRRGVEGDELAREYMQILRRDPCAYCARPGGEIDHIEPVSRDGSGEWDNLAGACRRCNAQKNDLRLLQFATVA